MRSESRHEDPTPPPADPAADPAQHALSLHRVLDRFSQAAWLCHGRGPRLGGGGWAGVVAQADVGIEMVLALFSRDGLRRVFDRVRDKPGDLPGEAAQMLALER